MQSSSDLHALSTLAGGREHDHVLAELRPRGRGVLEQVCLQSGERRRIRPVLEVLRYRAEGSLQIPTAALVSRGNRRQERGRARGECLDQPSLGCALDGDVEEQGWKPEQPARNLGLGCHASRQLEDAGPVDQLRPLQTGSVALRDRPELGHDRSERLRCEPGEPQLPESLRDGACQPGTVSGLDEAAQPVGLCQLVQDAGHDRLGREPPDRSELVLDQSRRSKLRGQSPEGDSIPAKRRALAHRRYAQQVARSVGRRRDDQDLGGWRVRG